MNSPAPHRDGIQPQAAAAGLFFQLARLPYKHVVKGMSGEVEDTVRELAKPKQILVVDDDDYVHMIFQEGIQTHNVEVTFASCVEDAQKLLSQKQFHFMFLDMRLDCGRSGMEILRVVNRMDLKTSVVVMSGSVDLHDIMEEANVLGVISFIRKPVQFSLAYVRRIFDQLGIRRIITAHPTVVEALFP